MSLPWATPTMRRLPLSTVSMAASSGMQNYHGYMAAMPTLPIERASGHASPQKRALLTVQSQSSVILFQLKKVSGCLVVVMLMVMLQQKRFQLEAVKNLPDIKAHKCTSTKALHQGNHRKCIFVILIDDCKKKVWKIPHLGGMGGCPDWVIFHT